MSVAVDLEGDSVRLIVELVDGTFVGLLSPEAADKLAEHLKTCARAARIRSAINVVELKGELQ